MKYLRKYILLLAILSAALIQAGCQPAGNKEKEHQGKEVTLYFLNVDEDDYVPVEYRLSTVDDPEKESQEIIGLLSGKDDADEAECKVTIPEEVSVNSITVKNGKEVIDFGAGYEQMDASRESLTRLAIVKSVCQVRGVDSVTVTVNGESIRNYKGEPIKDMTADRVLISDEYDTIFEYSEKVTLYYSDAKGSKLIPYEKEVKAHNNGPIVKAILYALMTPPKGEKNMISPLPRDLKINQTQIVGNICYVDLSSEIHNLVPEVEEEITVYAMVNSIISRNEKYLVQFTVDGERVAGLNGFNGFNRPLSFNQEVVNAK